MSKKSAQKTKSADNGRADDTVATPEKDAATPAKSEAESVVANADNTIADDPLAGYGVAELRDLYLRAEAEKTNIRKRAEEQVIQTRKFALEGFARGICEVCDCLEAALLAGSDSDKMREGVTLTLRKLSTVMEANGIRPVRPDAGASFDPALHQSIGVDANSRQPANTVAATVQCGYTINGRVVRAARVMVSKPADGGNSGV